jgi:hypothetical protein
MSEASAISKTVEPAQIPVLKRTFLSWYENAVRQGCIKCGSMCELCCTKCKSSYCGIKCQTADWPQHRRVCFSNDKWRQLIIDSVVDLLTCHSFIETVAMRVFDDGKSTVKLLNHLATQTFTLKEDKDATVMEANSGEKLRVESYFIIHEDAKRIMGTSSQYVRALPLIMINLLLREKGSFKGADLSQLIQFGYTSPYGQPSSIKGPVLLTTSMFETNVKYLVNSSLSKIVEHDIDFRQRVLYTISLEDADAKSMDESVKTSKALSKSFKEGEVTPLSHWKDRTSSKGNNTHIICLFLNRTHGFVIQAYYGEYSMVDWLRFDTDLKRDTALPAPTSPDFYSGRTVEPKPKFRGMLDGDQIKAFAGEIDQLPSHTDHKDRLAALTGIQHTTKSMADSYSALVYRTVF